MKIYVGNLNYQTTEDTLRETFSAYGQVEEVTLVSDRETGRPRGFGFVTMPNDSEAQSAIAALNGKDLEGRSLSVNEARPKTGGGPRGDAGRRW